MTPQVGHDVQERDRAGVTVPRIVEIIHSLRARKSSRLLRCSVLLTYCKPETFFSVSTTPTGARLDCELDTGGSNSLVLSKDTIPQGLSEDVRK